MNNANMANHDKYRGCRERTETFVIGGVKDMVSERISYAGEDRSFN